MEHVFVIQLQTLFHKISQQKTVLENLNGGLGAANKRLNTINFVVEFSVCIARILHFVGKLTIF